MSGHPVFKSLNAFHRAVIRLTGGRVGWTAGSMPVIELTTVGRRSGERRTVLLTSPLQDGETIVLVASRGGDDHPPAWLLNLMADSTVEVTTRDHVRRSMQARVASPEERARLWPEVTARQARYGGYQRKTSREIALVLLEPVPPDLSPSSRRPSAPADP